MENESEYRVYLLRLWRPGRDAEGGWRASLQEPLSDERIGFGSLDALLAYLRRETISPDTTTSDEPNTRGGESCWPQRAKEEDR